MSCLLLLILPETLRKYSVTLTQVIEFPRDSESFFILSPDKFKIFSNNTG